MTDRIPLADLTSDQLDALYAHVEAAEANAPERMLKYFKQVGDITAQRDQLPEDERRRLEAGDAPLLRIQLLHMLDRAVKAEARVAELEAEREKDNAEVDAKTEQQLNDATEVVQYFKALAERTQAWGEQHRDRANRYRARTDAVRAELTALNGETTGLNPYAMAGRRDAVARMKAALDTIAHDTPVPDDPRVAELEAAIARVRDLHQPAPGGSGGLSFNSGPRCAECDRPYRCDTIRTLDQPQQPTTEPVRDEDGTPICTCTVSKRCPACPGPEQQPTALPTEGSA
ncbi:MULTISPECIES: hypothetical protein [unclassified Streptomyces]|uniref:hypothetical protein n=1 Tax=unclassified Streptomyces TaxID=2593676 RepID=UPI0022539876|nr:MULTISPECIES: hypothetical protein [unclassified Streptomyces]MCX4792530.1 hypothetical protein [Streptomyces sp. NBC_01221]WSP68078.1 hypothetical protein OG466_40830 [Streptomyces sp. NBC_01240]